MAKLEREIPLEGSSSAAHSTQLADGTGIEDQRDGTTHRIRMRAYELYLERGAEPDNALDDWLQAEAEYRRSPGEARPTQDSRAPEAGLIGAE